MTTKMITDRAKARGGVYSDEDKRLLDKVRGELSAFEIGYIFGALDQLKQDRQGFREWLGNNVNSIYWEIESPTSSKKTGDVLYDMFMETQVKDDLEDEHD